jgi:hypothetical protein
MYTAGRLLVTVRLLDMDEAYTRALRLTNPVAATAGIS